MRRLFYLLVAFVALMGCQAQQKKGTELLNPVQFQTSMKVEEGVVLDVRTPKEYQSGHIENAVNMHIYDKDFGQRADKLDKNKTVYVYCKVGGRSAEAVEILQEKGFKHIVELEGGMDAWIEAGKSVKK